MIEAIHFNLVAAREDPVASAKKHRTVAEHECKRRDEKHDREQQEERLRTERPAHKRVASARSKHEEKRHLVEVGEHGV